MATFVLVHGAWHGGWCWYKLVPRLEAQGHRVLAPDLPGHGRDRSLARPAALQDYVGRISEILAGEPEPVVLVGHSMGGAVITGAAEAVPEKVRSLVYLAAFLAPSGGMMAAGAATAPPAAEGLMTPTPDGLSTVCNPDRLRAAFYADCPDEDVTLAKLCVTPQSLEPMTAPVTWTPERWGRIPRTYIACSQDGVKGNAEAQRRVVDEMRGTGWVVLETSHSPFFSMPDELARVLARLAA